jgi:hypothetical protein
MISLGLPVRKHFLRGAISIDVRPSDRRSALKIRIAPSKRARRKAAGAFLKRGRQVSTLLFCATFNFEPLPLRHDFFVVAGFDCRAASINPCP